MKRNGVLNLAFAVGIVLATGSGSAVEADRSATAAGAMPEMMHAPASGMMHGMPTRTAGEPLGRERPLLSLALRHRAELGLSEEQAKTLEAFVARFSQEAESRVREIETAERELAELLRQDPSDLAPAESKVRAIEKLRADLRIARIRTIAEGRAVLSPEQRTKLERLLAGDRRERRGAAPERGGGGAGPGSRGAEEMHRFMRSERSAQAMSSMMTMAERMGGGDPMLGMVRMMEMMSMMGGGMPSEAPREERQ